MPESKQLADKLIRDIKNGIYDKLKDPNEFWELVNAFKNAGKLTKEDASRVRQAKSNRDTKLSGSV